jgi:hypothetical protein
MTSTPRTRQHTNIVSTVHKHESQCATPYQTLTAKPVFMADSTVSVMELIAAGHAVALPHDAGVRFPTREYFMLPEESTYDWLT